jgi:hypothetical protein
MENQPRLWGQGTHKQLLEITILGQKQRCWAWSKTEDKQEINR